MTAFVLGRTRTWMLALWSGYIATWATATGSRPAVVVAWWLAGVVFWQAIAYNLDRPGAPRTEVVSQSSEHADFAAHAVPGGGAVQDWESEGGAIA